jgi:hypothetical protein
MSRLDMAPSRDDSFSFNSDFTTLTILIGEQLRLSLLIEIS